VTSEATRELARQGRLYPSVILHGGEPEERREAAIDLARTLLCEAAPGARPCGLCRHCRRVAWPGEDAPFHPDLQVLERDLKTSTSVDGVRALLRGAAVSPFEARGQVFVVASAETLTGEAANALLKALEEPHLAAPRNFLLLAPSRLDLLPTLRSRSMAIYLGAPAAVDPAAVEPLARGFAEAASRYAETGAAVYLLAAAAALKGGKGAREGWDDPRAGRPWALAAAAVLAAAAGAGTSSGKPRRALLALAEELLDGPAMRLRGIPPERVLEGLVAKHLA
jgi:DNA polymerase III subunit delta'